MTGRNDVESRLWIRALDSNGKPVDRALVEAAKCVWGPARFIVIRYLTDDSEAATILEDAVDAASRSLGNGTVQLQHPEAYLLKCVAREAIRRWRKGRHLIFFDPADLERLAGTTPGEIDRRVDGAKMLDVVRASLDQKGRQMLDFRILDYDWKMIAERLGYSNAHSAEVQFRKKIEKAQRRIQSHFGRAEGAPSSGVTPHDE